MHRIDLAAGAVLEKGCVYLVPLMERLALPARADGGGQRQKSSTGRLDLLTRTITDGGTEFDRIPAGYAGPLYAEICPRSFSVLVRPGMRLNQLRLRAGPGGAERMPNWRRCTRETPLVDGTPVIGEGLGFSVDLRPATGDLVGYRAKPHTGVIDLDRIGHYAAARVLGGGPHPRRPHHPRPRRLLHPGQPRGGDDPADPCRRNGALSGDGRRVPGALRRLLRPRLRPFRGRRRRARAGCWRCAATRRRSRWNTARSSAGWSTSGWRRLPERLYGAGIASNYQGQGLKLSKHFARA